MRDTGTAADGVETEHITRLGVPEPWPTEESWGTQFFGRIYSFVVEDLLLFSGPVAKVYESTGTHLAAREAISAARVVV